MKKLIGVLLALNFLPLLSLAIGFFVTPRVACDESYILGWKCNSCVTAAGLFFALILYCFDLTFQDRLKEMAEKRKSRNS